MGLWLLALVVGAAAAVFYAQSQKAESSALPVAGVAGAVAGLIGLWVLGWLGQFVGQLAVTAAFGVLAVVGLKAGNIIK